MKEARLAAMESYLKEKGHLSLEELGVKFSISLNTVRRDLRVLEKKGCAIKTYGGVMYSHRQRLVPFEDRQGRNLPQKQAIGRLAASFIQDGDVVFLDTGTTTPCVLEQAREKSFTVVTASLQAMVEASLYDNIRLMALPGSYMKSTDSFFGQETQDAAASFNITKAFMSASGFSLEHGATHASPWESSIKREMVKKAQESFLLVDSSKFGQVTLLTYCAATDLDYVLTEKRPDAQYFDFLAAYHTRLVYVEEEPASEPL